ncbi:MAG: protein kinase, partial [Planctomycetales bacterium]|nr:protein kinase [Planctomycetales bacterium]
MAEFDASRKEPALDPFNRFQDASSLGDTSEDALDSQDDEPLREFAIAWEQAQLTGVRPKVANYLLPHVPVVAQCTRVRHLLNIELRARETRGEVARVADYWDELSDYRELLTEIFGQGSSQSGEANSQSASAGSTNSQQNDPHDVTRTCSKSPSRPVRAEGLADDVTNRGSRNAQDDWPVVSGFRLLELLGEGAFGRVFRAVDERLQRPVAIKAMRPEMRQHGIDVFSEARHLASLDHPNIVRVWQVAESNVGSVLVTDYVNGEDLKARMLRGPLTVLEAVHITRRIAEGLQAAHRLGFVHRDLKPANILLGQDGTVRIADFGLVLNPEQLGRGPRLVGSVPYMSPEQARQESHRVDGRSDIFSLGIVLYEMLLGRRPFDGRDSAETLERIVQFEPRPPRQLSQAIPRELERVCLKMLSKRASDRYSCAEDILEDLNVFAKERESLSSRSSNREAGSRADGLPLVVPKGLRAFDSQDAGFFLSLLPGPFDREGLPEILRFWKSRFEVARESAATPVGVMYGPSGCGKSSLIRAGLLPRLEPHISSIVVADHAGGCEAALRDRIADVFPELSKYQDLATMLEKLRTHRLSTAVGGARDVRHSLPHHQQTTHSKLLIVV